ncbi:MAG TPA: hypothetical protein VGV87_08545 [Blastocatellia bacterium]|nr:hypothetical protein [Blastocatellia bacterium]
MIGQNKASSRWTSLRLITVSGASLLVALFTAAVLLAQAKPPYNKEPLLQVVKLNAISTQEVIQNVEQRGVAFQTTPAIEGEFRQAGARPELIEALRRNYRAPAPPPPANTTKPPASTGKPITGVPAGPPLSKSEIITMLQAGLPAARVEQFVEVRGVSFAITPDVSREITAAGGNRSLLGAITEKAPGAPSAPPVHTPGRAPAAGPDYDDLNQLAIASMQANNFSQAIPFLQRAVTMDPSKPTAFQLLGYAQLYGVNQDVVSAERSMRAALERGGNGVFRVYHDHDGFFNSYCQGSFFVTKTGVTFKADDGNHTFAAQDVQIKSSSINDFVGSQFGAFNVKVFQDESRNKTKTYNFAPATRKKTESNLILTLIKSY